MKRIFQKTFNNDGLLKSVGEITQRVCLINSFWGLEKALPLPPNIVMTGPLMKNSSNLLQELERKDSDLFAWMNDAQDKGEMIIYLSLGSMCGWTKWEIEGLFHGIKAIPNCRVIWSIKEKYHELIPDKNDPMFWISSWLPQVELVCHPAVKAALTHCGFGGTLEYINAGIPMLCLPHFGDQGPNAKLLKEAGVCEILIDLKHAQRGHSENIDLGDKPLFDAPKITKLFQKVLTQPEYQ